MAGYSAPLRFSTRAIPERGRIGAIRSLRERDLLPIEPLPGATPAVALIKWRLPGVSVLSAQFTGVRQIGDPRADGTDELFFGINLAGVALARRHGEELQIGHGDAVAIALDDGPFTVLRPTASRFLGLRVSRWTPSIDLRRTGPAIWQPVPAHTPALQLLANYLCSLMRGPLPTGSLADAVVDHVTALIALSLGGSAGTPAVHSSVRAIRLQTIKADITQHLTDPGLRPAAVAARHQISVRYLHRLFEYDGRTYSRFVLDQRLDLVHRRLGNPRFDGHTITAIATDVGFTDLSYFNRTFRRRYGTTPTDARRDRLPHRLQDGLHERAGQP